MYISAKHLSNITIPLCLGMVLETKNGNRYLYVKDLHSSEYLFVELSGYAISSGVDNVVKIYSDYTCSKVVWEKKEMPKLSEAERIILENIPVEFKDGYIARDKGHTSLWLYTDKPEKCHHHWTNIHDSRCYSFPLFSHLFQFVKWEDKEPWSIKELLEASE